MHLGQVLHRSLAHALQAAEGLEQLAAPRRTEPRDLLQQGFQPRPGPRLAMAGDREELKNEAADLIFHLLVLLRSQDLQLNDVIEVLKSRHQ